LIRRVTHHPNLSRMVGYAWSNPLRSISVVAIARWRRAWTRL